MDQERDRKRQHDEQFEAAQERCNPRRQLDAVVSEHPDEEAIANAMTTRGCSR